MDPALAHALHHLETAPETLTIRQLAGGIGVSQKRLVAMFERQVGMKPKLFSRVMRLQRVLRHVEAASALSWSRLACEHGYVDQAHLTRDFVALTGLTPRQYAVEKGAERNWVPLA